MAQDDSQGTVKSVQKNLRILERIRERDGAMLKDLVNDLEIARSTIHNHLMTLEREGYVVRENNTYHIGLLFLHFGEYARHRKSEYELARQYVQELANETDEEVDFTVPEYGRMISVYHDIGNVESTDLQVGSRFHMHNTAAGKAVLAEIPREQVEAIIERWGLPAETDNTITDRSELRNELEVISEQGFAVNDQELLEGFQSIGAAVKYPGGRILGALSVGGPTYRMEIGIQSDDVHEPLLNTVEKFERNLTEETSGEMNWWQKYRNTSE